MRRLKVGAAVAKLDKNKEKIEIISSGKTEHEMSKKKIKGNDDIIK